MPDLKPEGFRVNPVTDLKPKGPVTDPESTNERNKGLFKSDHLCWEYQKLGTVLLVSVVLFFIFLLVGYFYVNSIIISSLAIVCISVALWACCVYSADINIFILKFGKSVENS